MQSSKYRSRKESSIYRSRENSREMSYNREGSLYRESSYRSRRGRSWTSRVPTSLERRGREWSHSPTLRNREGSLYRESSYRSRRGRS